MFSSQQPSLAERGTKQAASFSPYVNNGGTTLGVCGDDFCIIASDTRISSGYSIHTRYGRKIIKLTDKCVLATSGMQADMNALHKLLRIRLQWFEHQHRRQMSTTAIAQLLSVTLYSKRFFPYYTFNVLGGVDDEGKGCCYSYDAVGSFERVQYSSSGTGQSLIQPLLDNQLGWKDQAATRLKPKFTIQETVDLVKDAFSSAGERDIYTGDSVDITVIDANGVREENLLLKQD